MPAHTTVPTTVLIDSYQRHRSVHKVGEEVGLNHATVHERLRKIGLIRQPNGFTAADDDRVRAEYRIYRNAGKLDELALAMGRTKHFLCRQARRLGLTDAKIAKRWNGKWKYMTEEAAGLLLESFKASAMGLGLWCKTQGYDALGFSVAMKRFFADEWEHVIEAKTPHTTKYRYGRAFEYKVRDEMKSLGYFVMRSPASRSPIDLVAIAPGIVVFVQCKTGGAFPPAEWNEFYDLCLSVGAVPLMAQRAGWSGIEYLRLVGRKDGTKARQPFELADPSRFVIRQVVTETTNPLVAIAADAKAGEGA